MSSPNTLLKPCPCGEKVVSLITDLKTNARFCFHCASEESNAVKVTRKMHNLYIAGKLDEAHYSIKERIRNLNGDWTPIQ
jgi:hypothetical protein